MPRKKTIDSQPAAPAESAEAFAAPSPRRRSSRAKNPAAPVKASAATVKGRTRKPRAAEESRNGNPAASHAAGSDSISSLAAAVGASHSPQNAGDVSPEEIARLAYSFWEARGCEGGSPEDDWYRAEAALRSARDRF